jgi:2-oxo-4-hydroxy-4-carboxy-5-ureidoimidazoline decarboxylase
MEVASFDELGPADAAEVLLPCCASRRWVSEVVDGRPYGSLERLVEGSDAALVTPRLAKAFR